VLVVRPSALNSWKYTFGASSMVTRLNFVSFKATNTPRINSGLSCPAPTRLHDLSQDEEERRGAVNRSARNERSSAIRRLQAIMPRHQATPIRGGPGCLWARGGGRLGTLGNGQPNEFANWTDEELRAFIKSGTKPLGIVSGKTQH
jgi:hypothetical protein